MSNVCLSVWLFFVSLFVNKTNSKICRQILKKYFGAVQCVPGKNKVDFGDKGKGKGSQFV